MSGKKYVITAAAALTAFSLTGCHLAPRFYTSRDIMERHQAGSGDEEASENSTEDSSQNGKASSSSAVSAVEMTENPEGIAEGSTDGNESGSADTDSSAAGRNAGNNASEDATEGDSGAGANTASSGETSNLSDSNETAKTLSLGQLRAMYGQDFTYAWNTPELTQEYPLQYLAQNYVLTDYRYLKQPEISGEDTMAALHLRLSGMISGYSGNWSVYVRNLSTNEEFVINDSPQPSASVMKLFVMGAVYRAMENGTLERTDEIMSMLSSMITYSSNTDANELLLRLGDGSYQRGIDAVNEFIETEGFNGGSHEYNGFDDPATVMDSSQVNLVSAADVGNLLSRIYRRSFASRSECNEIEEWMLNQDTRYKIPRGLPDGVQVGNKTGETSTTENDAAVVYGPECDYILVVLSNNWDSADADEAAGYGDSGEASSAAQTAQARIAEISSVTYSFLNEEETQEYETEPNFLLLLDALTGNENEDGSE